MRSHLSGSLDDGDTTSGGSSCFMASKRWRSFINVVERGLVILLARRSARCAAVHAGVRSVGEVVAEFAEFQSCVFCGSTVFWSFM